MQTCEANVPWTCNLAPPPPPPPPTRGRVSRPQHLELEGPTTGTTLGRWSPQPWGGPWPRPSGTAVVAGTNCAAHGACAGKWAVRGHSHRGLGSPWPQPSLGDCMGGPCLQPSRGRRFRSRRHACTHTCAACACASSCCADACGLVQLRGGLPAAAGAATAAA